MKDFYWLNKESRDFLKKGYLLEGVSPEERIRQISDKAESILGIAGFSDKFYNYMSKGYFSLATPVWMNFGLDRGLPISCYGIDIQDDTADILRAVGEIGMLTKYGGGTAGYFGKIRHRGAKIKNNGVSNGSVAMMYPFQAVTDTITQGQARRGYFAAYQDVEHKDIEEFLECRSEGNLIQDLALAVCISDNFMEKAQNGDKESRKVLAKIHKKRAETGFPYIFFSGNVEKGKPKVYKDKGMIINHSQMCVSPSTKILTSNGYEIISELEGEKIEVWNGEEFTKTVVKKTGENQTLFNVKTDNGFELDCTSEHKWYIVDETKCRSNIKYNEVRTHELKEGDKLIKFNLPVIEGGNKLKYSYTQGFFSGDGCIPNDNKHLTNSLYLYGEKKKLLPYIDVRNKYTQTGRASKITNEKAIIFDKLNDRISCFVPEDIIADKTFVPNSSYSIKSRLEWLAGFLDADGTVTRNKDSQTIQAASVDRDFLLKIQLMLQTLGCESRVSTMREEDMHLLPANNGTGLSKAYKCKAVYRLLINSNSLYNLTELGLVCHRLRWDKIKPNRRCSQFVKIKSVNELPDLYDTFCFTESKRHMGMFNGILTGQCTEIIEYTDAHKTFVCCISSINALHCDEIKNTDAIETLTYFLDAVYTEFIEKAKDLPYMEKAVKFAVEHRSIGVGVLGYHSYLQSKMIPFESLDAVFENEDIFKTIDERTLKASKELASLFGEPFMLQGYGERFTTRIAPAPTTSSSFILGQVSPSIEPILDNYFMKDLAKGKYVWRNPFLVKLLEEKGKDTTDVWNSILKHGGSVQHLNFLNEIEKGVFKTFGEISQLDIIKQAAQRQKYIDQSQSLNLMIHPDTTLKEVNALFYEAWKLGIKTLYYQRSVNMAQKVSRDLMNCSSCEA